MTTSLAIQSPFRAPDARIQPWDNSLPDAAFVHVCAKLDAPAVAAVRERLERYGLCVLRRSGAGFTTLPPQSNTDPTEAGLLDPNLSFLAENLGPPSLDQSAAKGSVTKLIVTDPTSDELAGNWPGTLEVHADGTHLPDQPAIVILQYLITPDVGGALRFTDCASVLERLYETQNGQFHKLVLALQQNDALAITKPLPDGSSVTTTTAFFWKTPYQTTNSLACRARFDSKVVPSALAAEYFTRFKELVQSGKFRISFTPEPGDIVLVDNWRVLHGRGQYATVAPRAHRRLWISQLDPRVTILLGVRPIPSLAVEQHLGEFAVAAAELLGPSADYLNPSVIANKRMAILDTIFRKAKGILGDSAKTQGAVPPRVLKEVLDNGTFTEHDLSQSYFAGILAASRGQAPEDDRGASLARTIASLSTYQIMCHYLVYSLLHQLLEGAVGDANLNLGNSAVRQDCTLFIPRRVFVEALQLTDDDDCSTILPHVLEGLDREGLIAPRHHWGERKTDTIETFTDGKITERGLIVEPSLRGVELFAWAHGKKSVRPPLFLEKGYFTFRCEMVIPEGTIPLRTVMTLKRHSTTIDVKEYA